MRLKGEVKTQRARLPCGAGLSWLNLEKVYNMGTRVEGLWRLGFAQIRPATMESSRWSVLGRRRVILVNVALTGLIVK
ncbi:hypothetical protein LBMAG42_10810 [Deltaproteobacteria bacterium]|nr:hypothetical protein LBMAG42_10810 [Deltaproteobacteria bacterium]